MVFCRLPTIFLSCLYLYHISFCKFILFILIFFFQIWWFCEIKWVVAVVNMVEKLALEPFLKNPTWNFIRFIFTVCEIYLNSGIQVFFPKSGEGLYMENSQFLRFLQGNNLHHQAENSQRFSYKSMSKFIFKFKICQ